MEPPRTSHQKDEQCRCDLDSFDGLCLPRAAGDVGAGQGLVRCIDRKLGPVHVSHRPDVNLETRRNARGIYLMDFLLKFHLKYETLQSKSNLAFMKKEMCKLHEEGYVLCFWW